MPYYPGIASDAFRHPLDRQAEEALRSVPGFDLAARKFIELVYERPQYVYLLGNAVQVGPSQYSTIYHLFRECVHTLDLRPEPTLFVVQNPEVNSYSLGEENPCVVVHTGLLDLLGDEEIKTVIAHELGHIKCGHTTLTQMAMWAMNTASIIGDLTFGLGNVVSSGLVYAFYEWRRMAELSCDRAALLVMDDWRQVMQTMMKVSGGSRRFAHELSFEEFERQAEQYRNLDADGLNQVYKFLLYNGGPNALLSHPFPVERLHYLKQWANSEEYRQIQVGNYRRAPAQGAVHTQASPSKSSNPEEVNQLKQELAELQQQLDQLRRDDRSS
ncbi:M48 family metallopeptidase [Pseudanabaena sp. FACHB-2040]|uniref:M48 family metallopeptidase n=1 Tax=Pseudanabaena sp. FACHB-2040 TaxID=2692859 RepID=UPI001684AA22|nr:M48 family metallopeptidase [Pseudanabaena sp. FACHB-2040]MBD2258967.1 M48 family metallopeptidase [Pseudanabaena sp. FACHB-2040]